MPLRAASLDLCDRFEGAINLSHLKTRLRRGRTLGIADGSVADANASLARAAGQKRDDDLNFLGMKLLQEPGEKVDFFETLGGFSDPAGSFDDRGQQHLIGAAIRSRDRYGRISRAS